MARDITKKKAVTLLDAVHRSRAQRGVTLMELMITLAIVAILAALATPSFTNFIADVRQSSVMGEFASDLHLARSESIKRNTRVLVCPVAAGNACGAGPDWAVGWVVCYDANDDGICDAPAAGDPNPIKVHAALNGPVTLVGPAAPIFFKPVGTASVLSAITLANKSGTGPTRTTTVTPAGSITTVKQ